MPVLPQAFWYNVDGKLKQVFFEEAKIPQEKKNALMKHLQRTRNYAGGDGVPVAGDDQPHHQGNRVKERIYGWYPPAPGAQFMTVAQAKLDRRVMKPNDWRAVPVIPDDRVRQPISTQIGADGVAPVVPPFATDPLAYKYSAENTTELPTAKAAPDFGRWEKEEAGRIPQWNEAVSFHGHGSSDRPQTVAAANEAEVLATSINNKEEQRRRPVTQPMVSIAAPSPSINKRSSPVPLAARSMPNNNSNRKGSARGGMGVEATPVIRAGMNNKADISAVSDSNYLGGAQSAPSLREIQDIQKKLSADYRWRFHVHGDPFAVKAKARPSRPAHWMSAKAEAPPRNERHIHYSDSTTFFYNTIPIVPLSFSVGQGLISERVIRDREARQKYAPKSTPQDRYFIPAFIY